MKPGFIVNWATTFSGTPGSPRMRRPLGGAWRQRAVAKRANLPIQLRTRQSLPLPYQTLRLFSVYPGLSRTPTPQEQRPPMSRRPTLRGRAARDTRVLPRRALSAYVGTTARFLRTYRAARSNYSHVLSMRCSRAERVGLSRYETERKEMGLEWFRGLGGQAAELVGVSPSRGTIQIPFPTPLSSR